jgi:cysteine synthase
LSIAVPSRHIPLPDLLDAARAIYEAAVRTPLVRIELDAGAPMRELYLKLEVLQPIDPSRSVAPTTSSGNYRRRVEGRGSTVSAGNAA